MLLIIDRIQTAKFSAAKDAAKIGSTLFSKLIFDLDSYTTELIKRLAIKYPDNTPLTKDRHICEVTINGYTYICLWAPYQQEHVILMSEIVDEADTSLNMDYIKAGNISHDDVEVIGFKDESKTQSQLSRPSKTFILVIHEQFKGAISMQCGVITIKF